MENKCALSTYKISSAPIHRSGGGFWLSVCSQTVLGNRPIGKILRTLGYLDSSHSKIFIWGRATRRYDERRRCDEVFSARTLLGSDVYMHHRKLWRKPRLNSRRTFYCGSPNSQHSVSSKKYAVPETKSTTANKTTVVRGEMVDTIAVLWSHGYSDPKSRSD